MRNPQEQSHCLRQREALLAATSTGDAEAQFQMGERCREGHAVAGPDMAEAARWYRLAADQNLPVAMYNLGVQYRDGLGVDANPVEAVRLIQAAAEAGYPLAQLELGCWFRYGKGVDPDLVKAAQLFIPAAREGEISAMGHLGDLEP